MLFRSLAKEGLDVPRLERLYLTTPQKDYAVVTQSIGPYLSPNVAVQPLSPATDRRLGGPLPRQLANQTRAHLKADCSFGIKNMRI